VAAARGRPFVADTSSECNPGKRLLHVWVVGSQLTVAVLAPGPIRSERRPREGLRRPPPGCVAVREPPASRPDGPGVLPTRP
jgi:hypothetical protein